MEYEENENIFSASIAGTAVWHTKHCIIFYPSAKKTETFLSSIHIMFTVWLRKKGNMWVCR